MITSGVIEKSRTVVQQTYIDVEYKGVEGIIYNKGGEKFFRIMTGDWHISGFNNEEEAKAAFKGMVENLKLEETL